MLTVSRLRPDGSLETREGKLISPNFRHFCHGYVVTSHKSQGRTHDRVVIAAEKLDAKTAYVACSRGRHEARVFTPDKEHLIERLGRSADRLAVTDVIGSSRNAFWRKEKQRAWQRSAKDAVFFQPTLDHSSSIEVEISQ